MGATVFFESASELATLTNTFKVAGVAADPTTVTLDITDPTGATTGYSYAGGTITKTTTGVYTKDIACSTDGQWTYVWTGTGTATDVQAGTWDVLEKELGRLYATVDTLKSRLGIPASNTASDYELHAACFAASRAVEQECERFFWRTASSEVRTFQPCDYYWLKLPEFSDLVSVTSLKSDAAGDGTFETTWATADYQLLPVNPGAAPEQKPYTKVKAIGSQVFPVPYGNIGRDDRVQITGVFGWPSVPRAVQQAALIFAADTFKLKDAAFGIQGFGDFALRVGTNTRVAAFLAPYKRNLIKVA